MIFNELYGAYSNAVAAVLTAAGERALTRTELRDIVNAHAFSESALTVVPALTEGRWPLLSPNGRSLLQNPPTMPLTLLQRRWLSAVLSDPRVRLFPDVPAPDPEVSPLFTPDDYVVYDRYLDGDPFEDAGYIARFRYLLSAVHEGRAVRVTVKNRWGELKSFPVLPKKLEYSLKDDKFRLLGQGVKRGWTVNLGRIVDVGELQGECVFAEDGPPAEARVTVLLRDERNALDRVLNCFSHLRREAERVGEGFYRITLFYSPDDETEMVIRLLSFGPVLKVESPEAMAELIKDRIKKQLSCGLSL